MAALGFVSVGLDYAIVCGRVHWLTRDFAGAGAIWVVAEFGAPRICGHYGRFPGPVV